MTEADPLDIQNPKQENQELKRKISDLLFQVEELKNEVTLMKKKLKKTEYERENAEGHVKNLKRDLDAVRKEFYEEKKKWKQEKESLAKACQREEPNNSMCQETSENDGAVNDEEEKDIKTVLEEAAKQAMTSSGFVYDERTGLYYDWNSGLYYDPNSCLYYNNQTGTYYFYNKETNSYVFHSQVELSTETTPEETQTENKPESVKKKKKLYKPKRKKKIPIIKIRSSSDEENSSTGEIISSDDSDNDSDDNYSEQHLVAPCIRAIVTTSDSLKTGTLFIVTCVGGTLGREKVVGHTIQIPDVAVSKHHCKFVYDKERRQYFIVDLASRNGSLLNGKQLRQTDKESVPQVLTHGDSLSVGGTTLEIHIHQGNETCDECEPGLLQAKIANNEEQRQDTSAIAQGSSENKRKKLLKNLKRSYGLVQEDYIEGSDTLDKRKYKDRADLRRVTVGSDAPNQPDAAPSSVHRPIGFDNKGRKMLEKMGWKDGEGLGKDSTGLTEPVLATVHEQSRGLGSGIKRSIDAVNAGQHPASRHVLSKTRERYEQLTKTKPTTTSQSDNQTVFVPQMKKESENDDNNEEK